MGFVKDNFRRFRSWQRHPFYYSDKDAAQHRCANCEHEFTGHYCPVCGQKADVGTITWRCVLRNILNVIALDNRAYPYSIWQLIWRPGYMIADYLNGHRQVSHPPANMLFVTAVLYAIFDRSNLAEDSRFQEMSVSPNATLDFIVHWMVANPAWAMIFMTTAFIFPTWVLFHFAPRHPRHTIPEGIHIQLFESTMMLILVFSIGLFHSSLPLLLIPLHYLYCYRQLFGYRLWGTFWRTLICFVLWPLIIYSIASLVVLASNDAQFSTIEILLPLTVLLVFIAAVLGVGYWISKKTCKLEFRYKEV